jgi:hypothetical protein
MLVMISIYFWVYCVPTEWILQWFNAVM